MSFSLLTEPWIPLVRPDGSRSTASITEALLTPVQWVGIDSTNPVECLSLHRLLLAICHRAIGPGTTDQRGVLLDSWPGQLIETYLQQWADRFDLFDPVRPFLQSPALADAGLQPKPHTLLSPDRASGSTRVFWDHSLDANPAPITPAAAALALVAHQQFTPGGLVRALRTSATRGTACGLLIVIPTGQTLQETLGMALVPQTPANHLLDLPAWEQPALTLDELRTPTPIIPTGPAQRYTHLSRAVLLQPGDTIHLLYGEGLVVEESPIPDPMAAVVSGKDGPRPLLLREDRAMWRDAHALFGAEGSIPPETIRHAAAVCMARGQFDPISLTAGGLLPDKAKIVLWRLEFREFSPALLAQGNAVAAVQSALDLANTVGGLLDKALWSLCSGWLSHASAGSEPDKKAVKALRESIQAMPQFWGMLEPEFWATAHQLGTGTPADAALTQWGLTLRRAIHSSWDHAIQLLGSDGRALAANAKAGPALGRVLAAVGTSGA